MKHGDKGLFLLGGPTPGGYLDRGAPLPQQVAAGGTARLGADDLARAREELAQLAHLAELHAIAAVRHYAADEVSLADAHWRAIRATLEARDDGLALRVLVDGIATRSLGGDALAGAAAALAAVAARYPSAIVEDLRVLAVDVEGRLPFTHPCGVPKDVSAALESRGPALAGVGCAVITLSDRAARGEYADRSGPRLAGILAAHGGVVLHRVVLPDDAERLAAEVELLARRGDIDFIACTGGTGIGPRDITPETLIGLGLKPAPGVGELLRASSAPIVRSAWLSRAVGGTLGNTFVVALPGSEKAVAECLEALLPLLPHTLRMLRGEGHE